MEGGGGNFMQISMKFTWNLHNDLLKNWPKKVMQWGAKNI